MQPRDITYKSTGTTIVGGPAPSAPAPVLVFALADTGAAGVDLSGSITNTGDAASGPWSIAADGGLNLSPLSGSSIAAGATVSLSATPPSGGTFSAVLSCSGASITGASQSVVVASAPVAEFIGSPTSGTVPFTTTFTNQSTGTYSAQSWNFGDGGTSSSANPTHAYTAAGTYTVTLTLTWVGGTVTRTRTAYVTASAAAAADTATLALPSTGTTGSPTTGTVTLNGTAPAAGSITLSGGTGATIVPSTLSWTLGEAGTAKSFTVSYAADGAHSVSISSGIAGVTVAGSPASHTTNAAPSSADWLTRSTGPSVVWAHNFDADAEVSAHLADTGLLVGIQARRVVDETGIGCLEQIALGATLAAPYTAGGATMVIDDATYWPDPAVTGPFSFMVSTPAPTVGSKNLFTCTARSGTTLTVSYVDMSGVSAFAATPQSYSAGAYAGSEASDWRRTFAALPAGENGKATDDPAASGAVPLRSKSATGTYGVPRDLSLWQYGWYGHASNQSTWADWTPWEGATTRTPRGVSQGAAAKYRLWDGDEFFIQFRLKLDTRFYANHAQPDPNGETTFWGRKAWAIQSERSSKNQVVTSVATSNRYGIPSTTKAPFSLNTYKAQRIIGVSDYPGRTHPSHQLNSPWDVAPYYANLSSSGKPSTGQATPDGSTAWELPDGEWVTFYMRVKPGRSDVSETEIDVKFARTEAPGYDGTYTTLMSVTDARIVYSGSGDYDYPDGTFSYPTVTTMDALPGFQAFGLMGYFNITQTVDIPPPKASYYIRMGQVIFSKAAIPAPAAVPAIQLSGTDWTPNVDGSGNVLATDFPQLPLRQWVRAVTNKIDDLRAPGSGYTNFVGNDGFRGVIDAWSGAAWDYISRKMHISGGGHGDTHPADNGVYTLDANTMRFTVAVPRSATSVTQYWDWQTTQTVVSGFTGLGNNMPQTDGHWPSSHTYDSMVWQPSGTIGTNTHGYLIKYGPGGLYVVNLDDGSYLTPYWNSTGSSQGKDFSYATAIVQYPWLYSPGFSSTSAFGGERYRLDETEATTWNAASKGKQYSNYTSGTVVYNHRAFCRMQERGEFAVLGWTGTAVTMTRVRLDDAVTAGGSALTDLSLNQDTITLTGDTGDFTRDNLLDYATGGGTPTFMLRGAGFAYDAANDCLWMCGNRIGDALYKFTGLNTNTWAVTKYAGAAVLSTTGDANPSSTVNSNGTYGRFQVTNQGGCAVAIRVPRTTSYPEVCRLS